MPTPDQRAVPALVLGLWVAAVPAAPGGSAASPQHHGGTESQERSEPSETPPLPEGTTLEEVLERAASPPPERYGHPVMDDAVYAFALFEQLEARRADDREVDELGWEAQGWVGGDVHKLWWKSEGEAALEGSRTGEAETELLYSRPISPFWSLQAGAEYADAWGGDDTAGRWSGVVAIQGLAPYRFELDGSLYLSGDGDLILEVEAEYDLRVTQRLVVQPRLELGAAVQDVPERALGAGFTAADLDLRWRYEVRRELAPYLGVRYHRLLGDTARMAEAAGEASDEFRLLLGVRFAL